MVILGVGGVCAPGGDKVQSRCKNGGADAHVVRFRGGAEQGYLSQPPI